MKPIIMSTEDARALLDGRKTMVRKPVTNGTPYYDGDALCFAEKKGPHYGPSLAIGWSPYKPRDVLYVRETWRVGAWDDEGSICVDYKADGFARREWLKISDCDLYEELWQQSSDDAREANATIDEDGNYTWLPGQSPTRWRSPFTMPREAARLFLRVTDVRVERIHSITVEDAVKEGVFTDTPGYWDNGWSPTFNDPDSGGEPNYINGFKMEWNARNAKRGYGWDSNPWVWVYTFERITKEEAEHGH